MIWYRKSSLRLKAAFPIPDHVSPEGCFFEQAKHDLVSEKQPSGEFVTTEQLGALAVFMCSDAATQVRGVAWNMDGGWVAQ